MATDDSASVVTGQVVEIDLTDNDDDPNSGDGLSVSEVVQPTNGFVEIVDDAAVSYTSLNDFIGVDSFSYTVSDEGGLTDQANVSVNVVPLPTLEITGPEEGETVTGPEIEVTFAVDGCEMSSPSSNSAGCHVHKYLGGEEYRDEDGTGFGHYNSSSFTISPLTADTYEFSLELIKNDGTDEPFEPLIDDSVTFEVEDFETGTR